MTSQRKQRQHSRLNAMRASRQAKKAARPTHKTKIPAPHKGHSKKKL